jgi:hypothetical protein
VGRQPDMTVLGTRRWKWIYEGAMIAPSVLVVVLLPMPNDG